MPKKNNYCDICGAKIDFLAEEGGLGCYSRWHGVEVCEECNDRDFVDAYVGDSDEYEYDHVLKSMTVKVGHHHYLNKHSVLVNHGVDKKSLEQKRLEAKSASAKRKAALKKLSPEDREILGL